MKKFLIGMAGSAVILGSLVTPVLATPADYNPPETASACGQMHGAFEYYSHGYIKVLIPEPPRWTDGTTGERNSAKLCQSHFLQ